MAADRSHYRVREVADRRGVKVDVVLGWIHAGELLAINCASKPGGRPRWRIPDDELKRFDHRRASKIAPAMKRIRKKCDPEAIEYF